VIVVLQPTATITQRTKGLCQAVWHGGLRSDTTEPARRGRPPFGPLPAGASDADTYASDSDPVPVPKVALERAIAEALEGGRCLVSFSGGMDSSLVLAVATASARRLGVPDPIPVSWRFEDAPLADETSWQEAVVAALGLGEWKRLQAGDELDWVGPVAGRVLSEYGLTYPPAAFLHAPLLDLARGGTLLTGVGGDQLLGLWPGRPAIDLMAGRRRLQWRDPARLALALTPGAVRGRMTFRARRATPWLVPDAARAVERADARELLSAPVRWDGWLRWGRRRRNVLHSVRALELMAANAGCEVLNPLLDLGVWLAVQRAGGWRGFGDRPTTLAALFGSSVPSALAGRRHKARFGEVFWRQPSRALARGWDCDGVDPAVVACDGLRCVWSGAERPARRQAKRQPLVAARLLGEHGAIGLTSQQVPFVEVCVCGRSRLAPPWPRPTFASEVGRGDGGARSPRRGVWFRTPQRSRADRPRTAACCTGG